MALQEKITTNVKRGSQMMFVCRCLRVAANRFRALCLFAPYTRLQFTTNDAERGFFWANCNGQIDGDAEFDDEYDVTFWQYLPSIVGFVA